MEQSVFDATRWPGLLPAVGLGALGLLALVGEYGHRQITRKRPNDFRDEPARWDLPQPEELDLRARDGLRIHAWLFRSATARATVILLHGHGGNKHTLLPLAKIIYPRFNLLLLDSRGHGESEGDRTTVGCEERLDVIAAVDELERRGLGPVGVWGTSMGAATAILAAAEDERIAAILADSPYARLRHAVVEVGKSMGYPRPLVPLMAYLGCHTTARRLGYPMAAFDPIEVVDRITPRPLFLIHGEKDEMIPLRDSHLLYARAGEPKELWVLPGLLHCRALEAAYEPFCARVRAFFERSVLRADAFVTGSRGVDGLKRGATQR
ncbi:MAG: alpha/beta fold hydrolase [Chloroflexota bacterium]|nr:alpha/beta fold hydrolase [Chloroflexota bacterium]